MLFLPGDWLASSGVFLQPCTLFCETKLREFVVSLPPQYVFWTEHRSSGCAECIDKPGSLYRMERHVSVRSVSKQQSRPQRHNRIATRRLAVRQSWPPIAAAYTAEWVRRALPATHQGNPVCREFSQPPSADGTQCTTFLQKLTHHEVSKNL